MRYYYAMTQCGVLLKLPLYQCIPCIINVLCDMLAMCSLCAILSLSTNRRYAMVPPTISYQQTIAVKKPVLPTNDSAINI